MRVSARQRLGHLGPLHTSRARPVPAAAPTPSAGMCKFRGSCASGEELDLRSLNVVHRPGSLEHALGLEVGEHWAATANVCHGQLDVLARHGIHKASVLRTAFALITS